MTSTKRFEMAMPVDLLARIDEWRHKQPVPPSRAGVVRWLVEQGLRDAGRPQGNPGVAIWETADER